MKRLTEGQRDVLWGAIYDLLIEEGLYTNYFKAEELARKFMDLRLGPDVEQIVGEHVAAALAAAGCLADDREGETASEATESQAVLVMHYVEGWLSNNYPDAAKYLREHANEIADQMVEDECALADDREGETVTAEQAWDQGYAAASEQVDFDGIKVWAHTVFPEGYQGNPYQDRSPVTPDGGDREQPWHPASRGWVG